MGTISLFNKALRDRSRWPKDDHAMKQDIFEKTSSPQAVMKTGWSSTFVTTVDRHDAEEGGYQMVVDEMSD